MKVFVAGATGTLGRPTVRVLIAAGHAVRALVRSPEKAASVRGLGAEPVAADLFDTDQMAAAVAGCDAVLHLATRIPPLARMRRPGAWRENDRVRNQGASVLVNAALAAGARVYVQESVTFLYRDLGDAWIYETAPVDAVWPLASARDAEAEAARFGASGRQGVVLRFSLFYAPYAPSTRAMVRLARWRLFPVLGDRERYVSSIHVDDAATAVVAALDVPAGAYNVSDDEPLTAEAYARALTDACGFRSAPHAPPWLARRLLGRPAEALMRSQRVANTMFKAVAAWSPRHPSAADGWREVARALARS